MERFKITYKDGTSYDTTVSADNIDDAKKRFKEAHLYEKKDIISIEPVKSFVVDYEYTVYCQRTVEAPSAEKAEWALKHGDWDNEDEYEASPLRITKVVEDKEQNVVEE